MYCTLLDWWGNGLVMVRNFPLFFRIYLIGTLILFLFMVSGGGIPQNQDFYFYLGYFATPFLFAFYIAFISYYVLKFFSSKP